MKDLMRFRVGVNEPTELEDVRRRISSLGDFYDIPVQVEGLGSESTSAKWTLDCSASPGKIVAIRNLLSGEIPGISFEYSRYAGEPFVLTYTGKEGFNEELIAKANERFAGTDAGIPSGEGEVQGHYLKRAGLVTVLHGDEGLQSAGMLPVTPLQSEELLKEGKLPNPGEYWEDLAGVLYDDSENGANPREARALKESLKERRSELKTRGLSESDLDARLLVVNAGLEKVEDGDFVHGVKPVALPGLTEVYAHEVLAKTGEDHRFEYGLKDGLPAVDELGQGDRTLWMPSGKNLGLRVLFRDRNLDLGARNGGLLGGSPSGRVTFAAAAASRAKN